MIKMSELRVMSLPLWIPACAGMTSGLSLCMVLKYSLFIATRAFPSMRRGSLPGYAARPSAVISRLKRHSTLGNS